MFCSPPCVDEVVGGGERSRGGEGSRRVALDQQFVIWEVAGEDGQGEDGAARFRERDVPLPPRAFEGESKEEPVADAADVRVLDVGARVTGDSWCEDNSLEACAAFRVAEARRLVDAAPEACCVPRLQ